MSKTLEIYRNFKEGIKRAHSTGVKVFINEETYYAKQNIDRLKKTMTNVKLKLPFNKIALVTEDWLCTFSSHTVNPYDYTFRIVYFDVDILFEGAMTINVGHNTKINDDESMEICGLEDNINNFTNRYTWSLTDNGKMLELMADFALHKLNRKSKDVEIYNYKGDKKIEDDLTEIKLIAVVFSNTISYFYELMGEDFEVKIIDQPKIRDKKGGKKRKLQVPSLFTIMRRPRTTVTVDLSSPTQERPKSNEPVVHRGPLEYGHKRKPHTRTYRHPRYVNVLGHTIEINGTWVGPEKERETVYLIAKSKGE